LQPQGPKDGNRTAQGTKRPKPVSFAIVNKLNLDVRRSTTQAKPRDAGRAASIPTEGTNRLFIERTLIEFAELLRTGTQSNAEMPQT